MLPARIYVNLRRRLGTIDPYLYGQFIEQMFDVVDGGIFDESSPLADESGFRRDTVAALRDLGATVLRWPGGNFASTYHWQDGVGPRDRRPRRVDPTWSQNSPVLPFLEISNRFGTDEFLELCRRIGAAPYLNVNAGTAGLMDALHWLEYCNYGGRSALADQRRANGRQAPWAVPFWGIGNEVYGNWQAGHMDAAAYGEQLRQFARFMKHVDPTIKILGVGHAQDALWNETVLARAGSVIDYLTIHLYAGSEHLLGEPDYYPCVASPIALGERVAAVAAQIAAARRRYGWMHRIGISVDEWSLRHWTPPGVGPYPDWAADNPRTVMDALFGAGMLHVFQRHPQAVTMACYMFTVNRHGALLARPQGVVKTPLFHVLRLYRRAFAGGARPGQDGTGATEAVVEPGGTAEAVDTYVVCDSQAVAPRLGRNRVLGPVVEMPYVDASAAHDAAAGMLTLAVINRHEREHAIVDVAVLEGSAAGEAERFQLASDDPLAANTPEAPERVVVTETRESWTGRLDLPPHSVTVHHVPCRAGGP
ncbi:MAG: hypothetical protein HY332_14955 [Chloroflexi bacterium]|nr:hypothetical protein [Chloroflexota bacterium]